MQFILGEILLICIIGLYIEEL